MSPTAIPGNLILQSPTANDPLLDLNTQPSLDLQFATSKTLDDRVSGFPLVNHQRDASSGKSAGTYAGSDGLIKTSPVNLLTYSERFDQGAWTKVNSTITPNSTTSPDGTLSADTFTINSGDVFARIDRRNLGLASNVYTLSYYLKNTVKQGTHSIEFYDSSLNGFVAVPSGIVGESNPEWRRIIATVDCSASGLSGLNEIRLVFRPSPSPSDGTNTVNLWGAQLEEGSTASTYIPTTTTISGAPRFDHDPVTGESLGLLIEESRTNQFTHSDFGNSTWVANSITKKSTNNPAPDGSNTAVLIGDATGAPTGSYLYENLNLVGGGIQTFTFYAKGTTTGQSAFIDYFDNGANRTRASISLDDGTVGNYLVVGDGVITSTDAGNGWWRCQLTITPIGTGVYEWRAGNNDSGDIYVWGAQVEAGSFPTSYIPTSGSTVTRAADVASIEGTNFSSWFTQNTGTVFVEASLQSPASSGQSPIVSIDNSGADYRAIARRANVGVRSTSSTDLIDVTGAIWDGEKKKIAATWVPNDCALVDDGVLVGTDTSTNSPLTTVNQMGIGYVNSGGFFTRMGGHMSRLTYYPYRLADATLQEITS